MSKMLEYKSCNLIPIIIIVIIMDHHGIGQFSLSCRSPFFPASVEFLQISNIQDTRLVDNLSVKLHCPCYMTTTLNMMLYNNNIEHGHGCSGGHNLNPGI